MVTRTVRGKSATDAIGVLQFDVRAAAAPLRKLIQSAVANARQNNQISQDALTVAEITVTGGPVLKRWMPRAQGRATHILKRTSTIRVTLVADDAETQQHDTEKKTAAKKSTTTKRPAAKKATKSAAKKTVTRKTK